MKKAFCNILMIIFIFSFFTGCSPTGGNDDKRVVAQVNKYKMMVEDLKYELKNIPYDESKLVKSKKGRKEYIDRLIEKEILLQEAQGQGLDRERDFMKSIENYWEQALLKLLLQRKSKEISGAIHVYDNEIEQYYKKSGEDLPLPRVRGDIRRFIRQEKETEAMNAWIEELKRHSLIKINEDVLEEVFK